MSVMDVPFFGTRAVPSSEDNRGVEKGEKRPRGQRGTSRAGPNRKSSLHDRFLQSGNAAGILPGCRYRSSWLERIYAVEKSTGSFYGHFFGDGRSDKERSTGIDPGILSKRLFPRSLTFTDFLLERVLASRP